MLITRTPLRISFLGGGSDYPEHYCRYGGRTLGASINKYSYVIVKRLADLFDYRIRVGYSRTELVAHANEVQHPAVRACLNYLDLPDGLEIDYVGDLPARAGLGSSSSFTVGLLHALHAFKGDLVDRGRLAVEAVHVEQRLLGERVGVQDQFLCAHGGLLRVQCPEEGPIRAEPLPIARERLACLESRLMLLYTGIQRYAHEVLAEQLERTEGGGLVAELQRMADLATQGAEVLSGSGTLDVFGELLHNAWMIKRGFSSRTTNGTIDAWYDRARRAGAIGGKLLGAGGGGFLLLWVDPARQPDIERALPELRRVKFKFERTGTSLLFYNPTECELDEGRYEQPLLD